MVQRVSENVNRRQFRCVHLPLEEQLRQIKLVHIRCATRLIDSIQYLSFVQVALSVTVLVVSCCMQCDAQFVCVFPAKQTRLAKNARERTSKIDRMHVDSQGRSRAVHVTFQASNLGKSVILIIT